MTPCYTRHELLPGVHQDIPHEHAAKEPSMCDANERNQRALYEINRQRTDDAISIRRLERILSGEPDECEAGNG